jgi:hypothetical protein
MQTGSEQNRRMNKDKGTDRERNTEWPLDWSRTAELQPDEMKTVHSSAYECSNVCILNPRGIRTTPIAVSDSALIQPMHYTNRQMEWESAVYDCL